MWWKLGGASLLAVLLVAAVLLLPTASVKVSLQLPQASPVRPACSVLNLSASDVDGRVALRLEGAPVEPQVLVGAIARKANGCAPASTPIDITADSTIKYGQFTELTDRLKSGGYTKLYLTQIAKH